MKVILRKANETNYYNCNSPVLGLLCKYSLEKQTKEAFENIRLAVDNQLNDRAMILHHEMLAFVRIQDGFKAFLESDFAEYDDRIFEK